MTEASAPAAYLHTLTRPCGDDGDAASITLLTRSRLSPFKGRDAGASVTCVPLYRAGEDPRISELRAELAGRE